MQVIFHCFIKLLLITAVLVKLNQHYFETELLFDYGFILYKIIILGYLNLFIW